MKVLFFLPSTGYYSRAISNPLGVMSIATYLKQHGHTVRVCDRNIQKIKTKQVIREFSPDIIGISVMAERSIKDALAISDISREMGIKVVWGGQMPTMRPKIVMDSGKVDIITMGEGENTWLELLHALENNLPLEDVDGLCYFENGKMKITKDREFADLGTFPVTDWSLADPTAYFQEFIHCKKMLYVYSSKGCPGHCSFCLNAGFHRCTHRKRPNDIVMKEIETLVKDYGADGFYFSDELWIAKKEDMYDFCRRVKESGLKFVFGIQAKVGQFELEDFKVLYDAGCRWILYGIESGSPERLKAVHKGVNFDKIEKTFEDCHEVGITAISNFIIGFPDETEEDLRKTVQMALKIKSNLKPFYHLTPMEGSELYEQVIRDYNFKPAKNLKEARKVISIETLKDNFTKVPDQDLKTIKCYFNWLAFIGNDSINDKAEEKSSFALQTIKDGLNAITKKGIIYFFVGGFSAAKELIYTMWNVFGHKKILKKYGIDLKKDKNEKK